MKGEIKVDTAPFGENAMDDSNGDSADGGVTVAFPVHFQRAKAGRKELRVGAAPPAPPPPPGKTPRVARLMALAIHFDQLIRDGNVTDYAELARLGHVTRARMTQIMNLLNLAPDIQEALLFLPPVTAGRDPIGEPDLRPLTAETDWARQRTAWQSLGK